MPRPSRGGRPRDPSRDGVIRAAILRLLADVGYGALTMDAVASEAGVGKATIYRRWRTKQDLVVDTISDLNRAEASPPDTGSLEGDLRADAAVAGHGDHRPDRCRDAVAAVDGAAPAGAGGGVPQRSAGRVAAVLRGDLDARRAARRGAARGSPGRWSAETTSALLVQRWLLTGEPVDDAYADEVLDTVVLPLVRVHAPTPS